MVRALILVFLLFFCSSCNAQDLVPGSYHIEYGGIYKIVVSETNRFLEGHWRDQQEVLLESGDISLTTFLRRQDNISQTMNEWRHGPPWWTRNWWDSFEPEKGGAPRDKILVQKGSTFKIINTTLFSLTNSFDFRWKTLQAAVDFKSDDPITVGVDEVPTPHTGWKLRFSPIFSFSATSLLDSPTEALRRIGLRIGGVHTVRKKEIVSVDIRVWYAPPEGEAFIGMQMALLQW